MVYDFCYISYYDLNMVTRTPLLETNRVTNRIVGHELLFRVLCHMFQYVFRMYNGVIFNIEINICC